MKFKESIQFDQLLQNCFFIFLKAIKELLIKLVSFLKPSFLPYF